MPLHFIPTEQTDMIMKFNRLFAEADKDKSNSIDIDEVKAVFKSLNWNLPDDVVEKIYKIVDANGNGLVSRPEFTRMTYVFENGDPANVPELVYLACDRNYDGTLNADELAVVLKNLGVSKSRAEIEKIIAEVIPGEKEVDFEHFTAFFNLIK